MVRLVLVCLTLAACYAPELLDCADTCTASGVCPDGLSCRAGFCRIDGASGSCTSQDAMALPDAMPGGDGGPSSCPMVPMAQGCALVGPMPVLPSCMAACAAKTGTIAEAFMVGSWHPAILDSSTKLAEAMIASGGAAAWIGLTQQPGQPNPAAGWRWANNAALSFTAWASSQPNDGDGVENGVEQCAMLMGATWADDACGASHVFLIEPF